jgi:RimJ/RimL family protein N-acetyltransferase
MSKGRTILQTERLTLRELTTEDNAFILTLVNSPGWLQYIGERNVHTPADAIAFLQNGYMKSYSEHGYGLWCVTLNESHQPIGLCGIINRKELDFPDLGFAFLPEFQGKGYAFEAANATLAFAFQVIRIPSLLAIATFDNRASIALLEKLGFYNDGEQAYPGTGEILLRMRMDNGDD